VAPRIARPSRGRGLRRGRLIRFSRFAGSIPPAIDATVHECGRFYLRTPWRDVVLTPLGVRWYGLTQAPNMPATNKGTAHASARANITRAAHWSTLATFRNIPARTMARPLVASAATFRNNQRPYHEKAHDRRLRYVLKCLHLRANSRRCKPLARVCNIQRGARLERQTYQGSRRLAALRSSCRKRSPIERKANYWCECLHGSAHLLARAVLLTYCHRITAP
jgi:hypothetical protein